MGYEMLLILTKREMDWLAELRNHHLAEREGFRLYERGGLTTKGLIEKLRRNFDETEKILCKLGERGL